MKRLIALVLAVSMLCISLFACDEDTVLDTLESIFGEDEKTEELTKNIDFEPSVTGDVKVPDSLLDFALELFSECADDKNAVMSPYSVIHALCLAQNGASGQTLSEFEEVFGIKRDNLEEFLKISLVSKGKELKVANSVWIRDSFRENIKEDFLTASKKDFASEVFVTAFDDNTLRKINDYILKNTEGLIENALDKIEDDTVMFLINTVYFKAEWKEAYSDSKYEDSFTNLDGSKSKVEYMNSKESKYISDGKSQGFIKEYAGGKYAFAAILPSENVKLDDYVDSLTGKGLKDMLSNPTKLTVAAKLPKFETKFKAELKEALTDMGLEKAFDRNADFSEMSDDDLFISRVIHDAVIKVDEKGTEAAASTIVDVKNEGMIVPDKTVYLDRPFLYVIFDTETYAPVFMGQITNF